jgi:GntR family transcriptional regulator
LAKPAPKRQSLADSAEIALRDWLARGRQRRGDRLPPEQELKEMLGISRGTLRTALERLEATGEIVRRQGSGTFVGEIARPRALDERLERLEPYSSLARGRGVKLTVDEMSIEEAPLDEHVASAFGVPAGTVALTISRVLLADGKPAATMIDSLHPSVEVRADASLRRALERGGMVMDVLSERGIPVAYTSTRITPRLVSARERTGKALGLARTTALLELEERFFSSSGEIVQHSFDLFAPDALDLHVNRWVDAGAQDQVHAVAGNSSRARRSK